MMKVHTSNYRDRGLHQPRSPAASWRRIAQRAGHAAGRRSRLRHAGRSGALGPARTSRRSREAIAEGADLVTFSGDKLLGGPQAGFIVGPQATSSQRISRKPDEAGAAARQDPARGAGSDAEALPRSRPAGASGCRRCALLARPQAEIAALAAALAPAARRRRSAHASQVERRSPARARSARARCRSRRAERRRCAMPSARSRAAGRALDALAAALRGLPIPVIGRIADERAVLDLRCLEDEAALRRQPRRTGDRRSCAMSALACSDARRRRARADVAERADGGGASLRGRPATTQAALAIWGPLAHRRRGAGAEQYRRLLRRRPRRRARPALALRWLDAGGGGRRCRRPAQSRRALFQGRAASSRISRRAASSYRAAAEAGRCDGAGHAVLDAAGGRSRRAGLAEARALGAKAAAAGHRRRR